MPATFFSLFRCSCNQCAAMSTQVESRCCQEIPQVWAKVTELGNIKCITEHPGFMSACLDVWVLQVAYLQYRQQYGAVDYPLHHKYRYVGYRQLVRWCWGYLGKMVRVPLPSCAVAKIRETYPEESLNYTGFSWPNI